MIEYAGTIVLKFMKASKAVVKDNKASLTFLPFDYTGTMKFPGMNLYFSVYVDFVISGYQSALFLSNDSSEH